MDPQHLAKGSFPKDKNSVDVYKRQGTLRLINYSTHVIMSEWYFELLSFLLQIKCEAFVMGYDNQKQFVCILFIEKLLLLEFYDKPKIVICHCVFCN